MTPLESRRRKVNKSDHSVRKSDNIVHQQSFILKIKNGQNESYKVSNDFSWKVELILKVESGRQQLRLMTS